MTVEFIRKWFDELDKYLIANFDKFSCDEYSKLYSSFITVHEERSGTRENLTGFSEYLAVNLIRYVANDLGLKVDTQTKLLGVNGKNVPDILVYNNDSLHSIVSVKAFNNMTNDYVKQDIYRIDNIRQNCNSMMINFMDHKSTYNNTIYKYQRDDHKLLFLKGNNKNLLEEVQAFLEKRYK